MQTRNALRKELQDLTGKIRITLTEMMPIISVAGMARETSEIRALRRDLDELSLGLEDAGLGDPCQSDVAGMAWSLGQLLELLGEPAEMTDEDLHTALLAAESFVRRGYAYLETKQQQNGGQHGE